MRFSSASDSDASSTSDSSSSASGGGLDPAATSSVGGVDTAATGGGLDPFGSVTAGTGASIATPADGVGAYIADIASVGGVGLDHAAPALTQASTERGGSDLPRSSADVMFSASDDELPVLVEIDDELPAHVDPDDALLEQFDREEELAAEAHARRARPRAGNGLSETRSDITDATLLEDIVTGELHFATGDFPSEDVVDAGDGRAIAIPEAAPRVVASSLRETKEEHLARHANSIDRKGCPRCSYYLREAKLGKQFTFVCVASGKSM